jgi:hypothetical protein
MVDAARRDELRRIGGAGLGSGAIALLLAIVIMAALVVVASFASWLRARRAATVDPSQVLRSE